MQQQGLDGIKVPAFDVFGTVVTVESGLHHPATSASVIPYRRTAAAKTFG
jgi:hypothetical protein